MAVSAIALLMLMGAVLGALGLLWMILANRKTRVLGLVLLTAGCLLFLMLFAMRLSNQQAAVAVNRRLQQERNAQQRAVEAARFYEELTAPRIKLSEESEQGPDGVTLHEPAIKFQSSPPGWAARARGDFYHWSDYAKELAEELGVEHAFIKRHLSKDGIRSCVIAEERSVRSAFVSIARDEAGRSSKLWFDSDYVKMRRITSARLYRNYVRERVAVERDGVTTLYTLVAVDKAGAEELTRFLEDREYTPTALASEPPLYKPDIKFRAVPPDWGTRSENDYQSDSEYTKQRAKELGVDYVFTYASPSTDGVSGCVGREKVRVRAALRGVVAAELKGTQSVEQIDLGKSLDELYERFVLERIAVEDNGVTTLYTQIGVDQAGRKELVADAGFDQDAPREIASTPSRVRPEWVDDLTVAEARHKNATVTKLVSGPYADLSAAGLGSTGVSMPQAEEQRQLIDAARRFVRSSVAPDSREAGLIASGALGMSPNELASCFVEDRYIERRGGREGDAVTTPTETLHTLVVFKGRDAERLVSQTIAKSRDEQLLLVGLVFAGMLAVLAVAYLVLKFDEATRGYYTKRLWIGVPLAIIGILVLLCLALTPFKTEAAVEPTSLQPPKPADARGLEL